MENNKKQQHFSRQNTKTCQSVESTRKSTDNLSTKYWPKNNRRREHNSAARNDQTRNSNQSSKSRPNVDKRPRPRAYENSSSYNGINANNVGDANSHYENSDGGIFEDFASTSTGLAQNDLFAGRAAASTKLNNYQLNSVYLRGSKKQNLNHLLNFQYVSHHSDYPMDMNLFGRHYESRNSSGNMQRHSQVVRKQKYNKEQFLQANFQFVIKSTAKPLMTASPDTLIDWYLIEQINIQTTEEPKCPICLSEPTAAKLTRCGHVYCWACMLHYLALSDKPWRKCPICYEAVTKHDLKSTTILQQRPINVDNYITFQLMCRRKDSMFIEKYPSTTSTNSVEQFPHVGSENETKLFSKFLIAKQADILDIVERERCELVNAMDETCPEIVFQQQALELLKARRELIEKDALKDKNNDLAKKHIDIEEIEEHSAMNEDDIKNEKILLNDVSNEMNEDKSGTSLASITSAGKHYYFYQSDDGQNIYLHPLNVKMLQACYGSLDKAPRCIEAKILQKEHHSMDEEHRRKFTCLGHLPLTCQFAIVEINLKPPVISDDIMKQFSGDLSDREKERNRRKQEERKRDKQINEINDRQMGKLVAKAANLNLNSASDFPTWSLDDFPVQGNIDMEGINIQKSDVKPIPTQNRQHASYSTVAVVGESPHKECWPTLAPIVANTNNHRTISDRSSECESSSELSSVDIKLCDVLAKPSSQKKSSGHGKLGGGFSGNETSAVAGNKKNKKAKKILFSTGMNFNGK